MTYTCLYTFLHCKSNLKCKLIMEFGKQLYKIRMSRDISQEELSRITGLQQASLSRYEANKATPNLTSLEKIASALNIHISEFFPHDKTVNLYAGEETLINDFRVLNEEHRKLIKQVIALAKSSSAYLEDSKPE